MVAIHWAGRLVEWTRLVTNRRQWHPLAVLGWTATFSTLAGFRVLVAHRVVLDSRHQMIAIVNEPFDDLLISVEGIGDEVERLRHVDALQQVDHLVVLGSSVSIGCHDALMDATDQRDCEGAGSCVHQQ